MDIYYNTKYNINNLDNMNDGSINLIIITICLLLFNYNNMFIII